MMWCGKTLADVAVAPPPMKADAMFGKTRSTMLTTLDLFYFYNNYR